jgi:hypothetical protein
MKEKENDETDMDGRNRGNHSRVCNYHFGSGRLRWLIANYSAKSGGQANASGSSPIRSYGNRHPIAEVGSVTAEFAIVLPAVLLVLVFSLSVLAIQSSRLGLIELAAETSRALARGESEDLVRQIIGESAKGREIKLEIDHSELMICVILSHNVQISALGVHIPIDVSERQCSRKSGL